MTRKTLRLLTLTVAIVLLLTACGQPESMPTEAVTPKPAPTPAISPEPSPVLAASPEPSEAPAQPEPSPTPAASPEPSEAPAQPEPLEDDILTLNITYGQFVERFINEVSRPDNSLNAMGHEFNFPVWDGASDRIDWAIYGDDGILCALGVLPNTGELTHIGSAFNHMDLPAETQVLLMLAFFETFITSVDSTITQDNFPQFFSVLMNEDVALNNILYRLIQPMDDMLCFTLIIIPTDQLDTIALQ
jgi:hypothetical protein